jgi:hypothetical protein
MLVGNTTAAVPAQVTTRCAHPAKLEGHFDAKAPNLIVVFRDGFEPYATTGMLAQKYHLTVSWIFAHALHGFAISDIDVSMIPQLQCEPSIDSLSFDAPTSIT